MSLPAILLDVARNPWVSGTSSSDRANAVCGTIVLGATVAQVSNNQRAHDYYAALAKPPGNPPRWALGPIWGTLYGMLGYAAHVLARLADHPVYGGETRSALALYYVQLALNFAYMPIFFQFQSRGAALADIVAITGLTLKLVVSTKGTR